MIGLTISAMLPDLDEPLAVLHRYYQVFSALNPDAVLPFFHEPCMFISAQGVNSVPVYVGLRSMVFVPIMENLRARGFARSEFSLNHGQRLSETLAIFTGIATRYKVDGTELEHVGVTYILRKENTDWRIAVLTVHNAL